MKSGALLLLSAISLLAQPAYEIRGTVTEPGLGGVAGAQVDVLTVNSLNPPIHSTYADGRGEFVLRLDKAGPYQIIATRTGYGITTQPSPITLTEENPRATAALTLVRLGSITGRVVDAETREPVEGVDVYPMRYLGQAESRWNIASEFLTSEDYLRTGVEQLRKDLEQNRRTDRNGVFTLGRLLPGEYAVTLVPSRGGVLPSTISEFQPEEWKAVDRELDAVLWPSGTTQDQAVPVTLSAGTTLSVGNVPLQKTVRYRAHLTLAQGTCPRPESMEITLAGRVTASGEFECGSNLQITGLLPGTYHLYAVSSWHGEREHIEDTAWATGEFQISDENVEVTLTPQRGLLIEGRITAAEGVAIPEQFSFGLQPDPLPGGKTVQAEQFIEWLPDHRFRMVAGPGRQMLIPARPGDVYFGRISYNGSPIAGSTIPLNSSAGSHDLEIVLDNKFATLTGTVMDGGRPSSDALVALYAPGDSRAQALVRAPTGTFQISKLPPGKYRAVVGSMAAGNTILGTGPGEKITVGPGETKSVPLSRPR